MRRVVEYKAIDPYYSDVTQTYMGSSSEEIDNIQWETEETMQGENTMKIYKSQVIEWENEHILA